MRNRHRCPVNGRDYPAVPTCTVAHHVDEPWALTATAQRYFFCDDPDCEVVYFGDDDSTILRSQLRTPVGAKEAGGHALLCYCFGVSRDDFRRNPAIKDYVLARTKAGGCSCEVSNPTGRCCLKDFPADDA